MLRRATDDRARPAADADRLRRAEPAHARDSGSPPRRSDRESACPSRPSRTSASWARSCMSSSLQIEERVAPGPHRLDRRLLDRQRAAIAPISRSSEKSTPSKPISARSRLAQIARDSVAGTPGSSASQTTCAVISDAIPAPDAARKGGSSICSRRARSCVTTGRPTWLSTDVSPWPGKCLPQARTFLVLKALEEGDAVRASRCADRARTRDRR